MFKFSFSGKAHRSEYWFVYLSWIALTLVIFFVAIASTIKSVDGLINSSDSLINLFGTWFFILILDAIVGAVALLAVTVRRCNDIGINPFWSVATFLPYIGFGAVLIFGMIDSKKPQIFHEQKIQNDSLAMDAPEGNKESEILSKNPMPEKLKFNGIKDLSNDAYKLYLLNAYSIKKNDVLEKFICMDKIFQTVDDAIAFAAVEEKRMDDELEKQEIDRVQAEEDFKDAEQKKNENWESQLRKEQVLLQKRWVADEPKRQSAKKKEKAFNWFSCYLHTHWRNWRMEVL